MNSGLLRNKLVIEKPTVTKGAMGGSIQSWSTFKTVWGALDFSNSRKVIAAKQVNSEVIGMATIRYVTGITPDMRINHKGTYYEIEAPIDMGARNRELQIPIKTGLVDG